MQNFRIFLLTISFLFFTGLTSLKAEYEEILSTNEHCVAYATPEKILMSIKNLEKKI